MVILMMCKPAFVFGLFGHFLAFAFFWLILVLKIKILKYLHFCSDSDSDGDFDDVPTSKHFWSFWPFSAFFGLFRPYCQNNEILTFLQ